MTRTEKINKLASAIKDYRGKHNSETNKWMIPPKPSALPRVRKWIERLGLDVEASIEKVRSFNTYHEFYAWLRGLE